MPQQLPRRKHYGIGRCGRALFRVETDESRRGILCREASRLGVLPMRENDAVPLAGARDFSERFEDGSVFVRATQVCEWGGERHATFHQRREEAARLMEWGFASGNVPAIAQTAPKGGTAAARR